MDETPTPTHIRIADIEAIMASMQADMPYMDPSVAAEVRTGIDYVRYIIGEVVA